MKIVKLTAGMERLLREFLKTSDVYAFDPVLTEAAEHLNTIIEEA